MTNSPKARGDDYETLVKDLEITEPYWVLSSNTVLFERLKALSIIVKFGM